MAGSGSVRVSPGVSHPDLSCVAKARGLPQPSSGQRGSQRSGMGSGQAQTPSSEVDSPSPTGIVASVSSPKSAAAQKAKSKAKAKRLLAAEDSLGAPFCEYEIYCRTFGCEWRDLENDISHENVKYEIMNPPKYS